jgi:hypothetical protein
MRHPFATCAVSTRPGRYPGLQLCRPSFDGLRTGSGREGEMRHPFATCAVSTRPGRYPGLQLCRPFGA